MSPKQMVAVLTLILLFSLACNAPMPQSTPAPTDTPQSAGQAVAPTETAPAPTDTAPPPPTATAPPTSTAIPPTAAPTAVPPTAPPPTAPPPVITSFTADRTTITVGEEVTLHWEATGGTEASISWVGQDGILHNVSTPLDAHGGNVTIQPDGPGDITLTVRNGSGEATAHVQLTINCPHEWMPALQGNPDYSGCPEEIDEFDAAQERFEHGFMIWRGDLRIIYVLYDDGTYRPYDDNFHEGDPESDPAIVPPTGLYQPIRGFGLVWRTNPDVRQAIGWATEPEAGYHGMAQWYQGAGPHGDLLFLQGIDGSVYRLGMGGTWEKVGD